SYQRRGSRCQDRWKPAATGPEQPGMLSSQVIDGSGVVLTQVAADGSGVTPAIGDGPGDESVGAGVSLGITPPTNTTGRGSNAWPRKTMATAAARATAI